MMADAEKKSFRKAEQEYEDRLADALARQTGPKRAPVTSYGMPLKAVYTPEDALEQDYLRDLGFPGSYPFTRGIRPDMYRCLLYTSPSPRD